MDSRGFDFGKKKGDSILGQPNIKTIVLDLLLVGGKLINQKLDLDKWQYVAWKRVIQCFFDKVGMSDHLNQ